MQREDIKKLAELARIDITLDEMNGIAHDFDSILAYVGQVQEVTKLGKDNFSEDIEIEDDSFLSLKNVIREDIVTENPGIYANKIIEEMPEIDGRYLKVKQIL